MVSFQTSTNSAVGRFFSQPQKQGPYPWLLTVYTRHTGWGTRQHLLMNLEGGTLKASYHDIKACRDERTALYLHHKHVLHTLIFQESFILAGGKTMAEAPM